MIDPADCSAGSISVAGDPVLPSERVVVLTLTCRANDRSHPERKDCDSREASDRALCRARSSSGMRVSTRQFRLPVILCTFPMTDFCARSVLPPQAILCQREPASPLVGLFRLLSHDETDRVEAAIPIAMHFVASNVPSPQEIGGNLWAKLFLAPTPPEMPERVAATRARAVSLPHK
jgi:hypothetical protein